MYTIINIYYFFCFFFLKKLYNLAWWTDVLYSKLIQKPGLKFNEYEFEYLLEGNSQVTDYAQFHIMSTSKSNAL